MKKTILFFYIYFIGQLLYAQVPQLWGMTYYGGTDTMGNIYSINADGSNFKNVLSFNDTDGANPVMDLFQAGNNKLYGVTTSQVGAYLGGNLFSVDPVTDSFKNIRYFSIDSNGTGPQSNLIQLSNGLLYGMTSGGGGEYLGGVIFSFDPTDNMYNRLYEFGNCDSGCSPGEQNLMQASNGKLYGLANFGDVFGNNDGGGVIFSFDLSNNSYTDLYNFNPYYDTLGYGPEGSLTEGAGGKLYGTAFSGGKHGGGVLFSLDTSTNVYTDLFDFHDTMGTRPTGTLILLNNGKLYGTCEQAGNGHGVIFSFNPSNNSYERLYEFTDYTGSNPACKLMLASDGKLYGTTGYGGAYQQGTIFSFDPDSNIYNDIFDFDTTDGNLPVSALIEYNPNAGLKQLSANNNQLKIYPNPTSGVVTISSSKNIDDVKVTNLLGQIIYVAPPKQTQFNFDLKDEGMFFVTVTVGGETETKKVVVINK